MDDTPTVTLSLMAKDSINTYRGVQTPSLQIRCREKSTDLYIINGASANPELGVRGATVRLRIDSAPAFSQVWDRGTEDSVLFATNSISLAKQLAGAKTLLYEFTPTFSNPQQTTFELSGLADQLPKVAAACGWEI